MPQRALLILILCCAAMGGEPVKPARGEAQFIAGSWFQYLGDDERGAPLWLYPHLDGVSEIFKGDGAVWPGMLGSRFNRDTGRFTNCFNGAEVLNEFIAAASGSEARLEAARLLRLFVALHRAPQLPYYLRAHLQTIDAALRPIDHDWVDDLARFHAETLARVSTPGARLPALQPKSATLDAREYYRRLVSDGYLDIAVVGGNLYSDTTGTYNSWRFVEEFESRILKQGFRAHAFRTAADKPLFTKTISLLGQPVVVRLHSTGGSSREHRIRRGVANFVEGLANADVFLYHGHSNLLTGTYYISETGAEFSRFQIGMDKQTDLLEKCHGLNGRPHQIIAFQSCSSYEKYCRPVRWFFEQRLGATGNAGFVGNSDYCYQVEFAPRFAEFVAALLEGKGARDIQQRVDSIRPERGTPHIVMRGVLQPRLSFIVPRGVDIADIQEASAKGFNLVTGTGSDGKTYVSAEMFPQNRAGELVQLLPLENGVYGLMDDGIVFECSRETGGAMIESAFMKSTKARFSFITTLRGQLNAALVLIARDGVVYGLSDTGAQLFRAPWQAPAGVKLVALTSAGNGLAATDAAGKHYSWNVAAKQFVPTDTAPDYSETQPSLTGHGKPGVLWTAKDKL